MDVITFTNTHTHTHTHTLLKQATELAHGYPILNSYFTCDGVFCERISIVS